MTPDINLISNQAVTLPGAEGTLAFVKVSEDSESILRRVQATANTYPRELKVIQQEKKLGTRAASRRTVIQLKESDWSTIVPNENGIGGRADGQAIVTLTINRPLGAGYTAYFTNNKILTLLGTVFHLFSTAGSNVLAGEK